MLLKKPMPNINQSIEWVLFLQHTKQVENTVSEPFYYSRIGISNAVFDLHLQSKHPDSRWNQPNTNAIIWKWDIFRDTFGVQMVQVEISYHSIYVRTFSSCRWLHPSLLSTSSRKATTKATNYIKFASFLWAFTWYHSQKEGCGAFLGQDQMGPALPPILAAIPPPSSNFGL